MAYTLRGRLESRLAAVLLPFLAACVLAAALGRWWPLELAGLMIGVGLALDAGAYHRLLPYQPGWAAVPLGALELALVMGLARVFDVAAPLDAALAFFAASWLWAQVLGHAALPLVRLSYGDDGGELGRGGTALGALAPVAVAAVLGVAWMTQPPLVRLESGVHRGPLVLDHAQRLVGEPGTVVRGGIVITADDVTVRDVAVVGGKIGIEVRDAEDVLLDGVDVTGAELDGISARRSTVTIRDCLVHSPAHSYAQGIDLSFAMYDGHSLVERCTVVGGQEGIVTHMMMASVRDNRVLGTTMRAIAMTEMSMGDVVENEVASGTGVGIYCGDYSHCEIERNTVLGMRADPDAGRSRAGWAIQANYYAHAEVDDNRLVGNARAVGEFVHGRVTAD
jgi:hypothetical protein